MTEFDCGLRWIYLFSGVATGIGNWCIGDNWLIGLSADAETTASRQGRLNGYTAAANAKSGRGAGAAATGGGGGSAGWWLGCLLAVHTISVCSAAIRCPWWLY